MLKRSLRDISDRVTGRRDILSAIATLPLDARPGADAVLTALQNAEVRIAERLEKVFASSLAEALESHPTHDEPPVEKAILQWREFYDNRHAHYAEILKELGSENDGYTQWYRSGGYGYDPKQSRNWIINETSLTDFRGTCLDIGSGDGFWSWVLSEWFHVYGIDPVAGGVELANAVKRRMPIQMQRRVDFIVGDALTVEDKYDVVFCRAPSFFNYPIYKPFTIDLMDRDRKRLVEVWAQSNPPEVVQQKLAAYPKAGPIDPGKWQPDLYANNWRQYLDKMMSITNKVFVFILSTKPEYYGVYIGDTYNHDPEEVKKLFAEYGRSNVRMDSTNTYIVGELFV